MTNKIHGLAMLSGHADKKTRNSGRVLGHSVDQWYFSWQPL